MTEYFAVIDDEGRTGPFRTMQEAAAILEDASVARGHTDEEARNFFLDESSVVKVQIVDGKMEFFNLGWLAREEFRMQEPSSAITDIL